MGNKKNSITVTVSPEAWKALIVLSCATILTLYVHTAVAPAFPNITQHPNTTTTLHHRFSLSTCS